MVKAEIFQKQNAGNWQLYLPSAAVKRCTTSGIELQDGTVYVKVDGVWCMLGLAGNFEYFEVPVGDYGNYLEEGYTVVDQLPAGESQDVDWS